MEPAEKEDALFLTEDTDKNDDENSTNAILATAESREVTENHSSRNQKLLRDVDDLAENEEEEDPLNKYKSMTSETCLQSKVPQYPFDSNDAPLNTVISIAPGQNKHPVSLMKDQFSEECCFPALFPTGQFGFNARRNIPLTVTKYCNSRLLNYTGRFASNPEYLFFIQYIVEQKKVSDNIAIALRKMNGNVTAGALRGATGDLQQLIFNDQTFLFLQQIPGSPPYWKKFQNEVLAMVKQLGMPTWFMTLSCADL